jgi:hypothetical protein
MCARESDCGRRVRANEREGRVIKRSETGIGEDALSCQQRSLPGGTYDLDKGTTGVVFDPSPTARAAATSTKSRGALAVNDVIF